MASYGGLQILKLGPGSRWTVNPLVLPADYLSALEEHVLLGFSGISRTADQHARAKIENIQEGKTTSQLQDIQGLASEALELLQKQANLDKICGLLDCSWKAKRRLADKVSSDWMDDLYDTALRAGAFGGKLMGAGGGGFFFFLAPPYCHQSIREALPQIKVWVPFQIDFSGSQVIFHNLS